MKRGGADGGVMEWERAVIPWLVAVKLRSSRLVTTGNYQIAEMPTYNRMKCPLLPVTYS
jgi:hypothetical protein